MVRDAPEVVVKNALQTHWDAANTLDITPNIHHGWLDLGDDTTQVTLSNPEDSPVASDTGYTGIGPNGPTRDIAGTLQVNAWTSREHDIGATNARQLAYHYRVEIERIISEVVPQAAGSDLQHLSYMGSQRRPHNQDEPQTPVTWRYRCVIGYGYKEL